MEAEQILPCPRCGSGQFKRESHPATGPMVECAHCGACSPTYAWQDGFIMLQRDGKYRRPVTERHPRAAIQKATHKEQT